jgi:hypothetical protein
VQNKDHVIDAECQRPHFIVSRGKLASYIDLVIVVQGSGSGSTIRIILGSWIRNRIRYKCWIWIRLKSKCKSFSGSKWCRKGPGTLTLEVWRLLEGL